MLRDIYVKNMLLFKTKLRLDLQIWDIIIAFNQLFQTKN